MVYMRVRSSNWQAGDVYEAQADALQWDDNIKLVPRFKSGYIISQHMLGHTSRAHVTVSHSVWCLKNSNLEYSV